jgi:hypothetical protein|tara:strand:+ start:5945 stop:6127 length:183 start_codon:yes stop_codon:yes gene_type:complete
MTIAFVRESRPSELDFATDYSEYLYQEEDAAEAVMFDYDFDVAMDKHIENLEKQEHFAYA